MNASNPNARGAPAARKKRKRSTSPPRNAQAKTGSTLTPSEQNRSTNKNDAPLTAPEHRALVKAIFQLGVKESSPASIFEHMTPKSKEQFQGLNLERIKSKLQKYRKSKDKNKEEFMSLYDSTMRDFGKVLPVDEQIPKDQTSPSCPLEKDHLGLPTQLPVMPPIESLSSGEVAAFLSFSVMADYFDGDFPSQQQEQQPQIPTTSIGMPNDHPPEVTSSNTQQHAAVPASNNNSASSSVSGNPLTSPTSVKSSSGKDAATALVLPPLTPEERQSSIGVAIHLFEGLFSAMTSELQKMRNSQGSNNSTMNSEPNHENHHHHTLPLLETTSANDVKVGGVEKNPMMENESLNDSYHSTAQNSGNTSPFPPQSENVGSIMVPLINLEYQQQLHQQHGVTQPPVAAAPTGQMFTSVTEQQHAPISQAITHPVPTSSMPVTNNFHRSYSDHIDHQSMQNHPRDQRYGLSNAASEPIAAAAPPPCRPAVNYGNNLLPIPPVNSNNEGQITGGGLASNTQPQMAQYLPHFQQLHPRQLQHQPQTHSKPVQRHNGGANYPDGTKSVHL